MVGKGKRALLLCLAAVALVACGGGGGGGGTTTSQTPAVQQQSFEGIWGGTAVSASGQRVPMYALVLPSGETVVTASSACDLHTGTSTVSGKDLSVRVASYANDYCYGDSKFIRQGWTPTSVDSPAVSSLTATGTVSTAGTAVLNYSAAWGDSGQITLNYSPIYTRGSSLAKVAGNYGNGSRLALAIDSAGRISGQETVTNSPYTETVKYLGQLNIIDSTKNYYRLTLSRAGASSKTFEGYAFLLDQSPGTENGLYVFGLERAGTSPFVHFWIKQ